MYRELGPPELRRLLGLEVEDLPEVLLLVGIFDVEHGAKRFARYLDDSAQHLRFPSYRGTYKGRRVAVAAALGGPMAAMHVHTWAGAGVPVVVQLGWYGALQAGTNLGDVVVPSHAEREDGVSDWYLSKGILADASPALCDAIAAQLSARQITVGRKAIYSTSALLAESREVIADWGRHGWHGVDMETAATFAVAKSLGAQRAAALIRIDDLVAEDHSLAEEPPELSRKILREREREVMHGVLDAVFSS